MALIDVEKLVPEVYVEESRDFQLLCRLYSLAFSSVKYDVDSIQDIIDTKNCREKILKLLQTKLGFFTTTSVTDDELRYVLQAFPTILKYKGSIKAVQMSIAAFLKARHISADYAVLYLTENSDEERTGLKPYTIGISINTSLVSHELLQAILKYVVPAGFNLAIYFFNKIEIFEDFVYNHSAKVLYVYYRDNSMIRAQREKDNSYLVPLRQQYGKMEPVVGDTEDRYYADEFVNAVDTVFVATKNELIDLTINRYTIDVYEPNSLVTVNSISNRLNSYVFSKLDALTLKDLGYSALEDDSVLDDLVPKYDLIQILGGKIPRYDKTRRHPMTYYSELIPYVYETTKLPKDKVTFVEKTLLSKLKAFLTYLFEYDAFHKSWYLEDNKVNLANYGIIVDYTYLVEDESTIQVTVIDQRSTIDHVKPVSHVYSLNDREDKT